MNKFGRAKIFRDETVITAENVVNIVAETLPEHLINVSDINECYDYYKGNQDILNRVKTIREDINNKTVENRVLEAVEFKSGYLLSGSIKYISRSEDPSVSLEIGKLNDLMVSCDKESQDMKLVEWIYICGVGYRIILPNSKLISDVVVPKLLQREVPDLEEESPFKVNTVDPRTCYVIYNSGIEEEELLGVKFITKADGTVVVTAFSKDTRYDFNMITLPSTIPMSISAAMHSYNTAKADVKATKFTLGRIPIIEYSFNNSRLGLSEVIIPLQDAMNKIASNRLDGIEQFIQSLLLFYNCEIDPEKAKYLREAGLILLKSSGGEKPEIKEISSQLNQQQTQTLVDYMYQTMLNIIGMPNRNGGGGSTSDTGAATLVRDGWETTERRSRKDEIGFNSCERRRFLPLVLKVLKSTIGTSLKLSDIGISFPPRSYKNKTAMAQMLALMLSSPKIHPLLAFTECELFDDPQSAYLMSKKYYEEEQTKAEAKQAEMLKTEQINSGQDVPDNKNFVEKDNQSEKSNVEGGEQI